LADEGSLDTAATLLPTISAVTAGMHRLGMGTKVSGLGVVL